MLIRYGYRLELHCASPTLFTALLDAHRDHAAEIKTLGTFEASPHLDVGVFTDVYGNEVTRFVAPAGVTTISRDAVFECDGGVQPIHPRAEEVPLAWTEELSVEQAVFS